MSRRGHRRPRRLLVGLGVLAVLASFASAPGGANAAGPDVPPPSNLHARSELPPGESGTYTAAGQARYEVDKDPSDFGPHANDQSDYWTFGTKDADFATPTGTPTTPAPGVRIYRDDHGVPQVYGDTAYDTWFGDGYAAATDRLFEADAVRRTAEGTLAELTGPGQVPADIAERTVFYTKDELDRQLAALSPESKTAVMGYSAGMAARIQEVDNNPTLLPVEYSLLTQPQVQAWTPEDTLAAGVYITRDVAVQGGGEFQNVGYLHALEAAYGTAKGRAMFQDFFGVEDPKAAVTIQDKVFSNQPPADRSVAAQQADFTRAADYADTLPAALASGVGTGAAPVPATVGLPGASVATVATAGGPTGQAATELREISQGLETFAASIHGGSFAFAIAGNRTASGHAMLVSEPQLDYSYPGLLWESEVHGGGYDARGVNVPGLPGIGIGWNRNVAWGLTTGYSKNLDSFIETTRDNPTAGGPPQYLHDGVWLDESCRTEVVHYRPAEQGVPVGPALSTASYQVCRTGHGPVIATAPGAKGSTTSLAHSVDYADWMRDLQTLNGILDWDSASSISDIVTGVKQVTWNENIIAADSQGSIGYWHPGLYFRRADGVDQRFPLPGTGSYDPVGFLSYDEMPHEINPADGYLANWNTQPAHGWTNGDSAGVPVKPSSTGTTTRPGGPSNRVVKIQSLLSARKDFTPADITTLDQAIGEGDFRAAGYLPLMTSLTGTPGLSAGESAALSLLGGWDGRAYAPGAPGGSSPAGTPATSVTDGPAATLFASFVDALRSQLFGSLPSDVYTRLAKKPAEGHQYDVTPVDNLVQRVLRPGYSGLTPSMDYTGGRSAPTVVKAALDDALAALTQSYGQDPATWRRPHALSHLNSLTNTVGPTGITQPFEDRGSWVEFAAFTTGSPYAVTTPPSSPVLAAAPPATPRSPARTPAAHRKAAVRKVTQPAMTLAYTGLGAGLPVTASVLLLVAAWAGRRRARRSADR